MPAKDRDVRNATQRRWYYNHREERIAQITAKKRTDYAGTCVICGATTVGESKARPGSDYCYRHRKEQMEAKRDKVQDV